jgi:hypothetical protein
MTVLPAIFALLVAAAGWYYAFYSTAAHRLSGVEDPAANRVRIRLRRMNGLCMILLGATFYLTASAIVQRWHPLWILIFMATLCFLLFVTAVLALADVRLTRKMHQRLRSLRRDARNLDK